MRIAIQEDRVYIEKRKDKWIRVKNFDEDIWNIKEMYVGKYMTSTAYIDDEIGKEMKGEEVTKEEIEEVLGKRLKLKVCKINDYIYLQSITSKEWIRAAYEKQKEIEKRAGKMKYNKSNNRYDGEVELLLDEIIRYYGSRERWLGVKKI